jgi:hypothetical protein
MYPALTAASNATDVQLASAACSVSVMSSTGSTNAKTQREGWALEIQGARIHQRVKMCAVQRVHPSAVFSTQIFH